MNNLPNPQTAAKLAEENREKLLDSAAEAMYTAAVKNINLAINEGSKRTTVSIDSRLGAMSYGFIWFKFDISPQLRKIMNKISSQGYNVRLIDGDWGAYMEITW